MLLLRPLSDTVFGGRTAVGASRVGSNYSSHLGISSSIVSTHNHEVLGMPALSPTMSTGNITTWRSHLLTGRRQPRPTAGTDVYDIGGKSASRSLKVDGIKGASDRTPSNISIYIAQYPLEGVPRHPLFIRVWPSAMAHAMVIVRVADKVVSYDFLPRAPTSPKTALHMLTHWGRAPGEFRRRELSSVPHLRCWPVVVLEHDQASLDDLDAVIDEVNKTFGTELRLLVRDCRHYAISVVECLAGEEYSELVARRLQVEMF